MEEWKDVVGYENIYMVSNMGRVKSIDRTVLGENGKIFNFKGRLIKPSIEFGYERVTLSKNNKRKKYRVHRLVAIAFLGDYGEEMLVNHIDENKRNNKLENIEWVTPKENYHHSYEKQKEKSKKIRKKLTVIDSNGKIKIYESVNDCIEDLGLKKVQNIIIKGQ